VSSWRSPDRVNAELGRNRVGAMNQEFEQLVSDYLDDALSEADLARLAQRVREDATCRQRFCAAVRLHSLCREVALLQLAADIPASALEGEGESGGGARTTGSLGEAPTRDARLPLPKGEGWGEGEQGVTPPTAPRVVPVDFRRRVLRWAAAAALVAALALATWLINWGGKDRERNLVQSGQVVVAGQIVSEIPDGISFSVTGAASAVVQLKDGSRATFAPGTQGAIRGPGAGLREVVELTIGTGRFQVRQGGGQFRVDTAVGNITVLGTEFSVALRPVEETNALLNYGGFIVTSKARTVLALTVAVTVGNVGLSIGGKTYSLGAGQTAYAAEPAQKEPEGVMIRINDSGKIETIRPEAVTGVPGGAWIAGGWVGGLEPAQREALAVALRKSSNELAAIQTKINAAQKELVKASLAEKPDPDALKVKTEEIGKLQAQMLLIRANALTTLGPSLTPEQRNLLENTYLGSSLLTSGGWMYPVEPRQPIVIRESTSGRPNPAPVVRKER
jgi:hypothetical protein